MKPHTVVTLALAWLALSACSAVYSPEPLGDKPMVLDSSWSGTWLADGDVVTTAVADAENGLLQAAWLETKPGGIEMETFQALIRTRGDLVIANVRDKDSEHGYHWMIINKQTDSHVLLWFPDAEQFRAAISEKKIPGKVLYPDDQQRDDVVLGKLEREHFELIDDPASGLLGWKNPSVMTRISD